MVSIVIYLKKEHQAKQLVQLLLSEHLIASASIDENNVSYLWDEEGIIEVVYTVITAQSKAMLFNEIVKSVETQIGENTPIHAIPIVGSNRIFDQTVRTKTLPI
jgi:uncharacterized protein involved in tolerance to divalent cations